MRAPLCVGLVTVAAAGVASAVTVPFDSPRWKVEAKQSRLEEYRGKRCLALDGGSAELADVEFRDGVIEFEVAFGPERGFVGAAFRIVDDGNYEHFYIRPHQSGNPDANQYTPVFNGVSGWQLYHGEGYGAPVTYGYGEWIPVRIVVSGTQAEIYVGDLEKPAVFADELKRPVTSGRLGLTARNAPARFASFRYTTGPPPRFAGAVKRSRPARLGTIATWRVSKPFAEDTLDGVVALTAKEKAGRSWSSLACESSGLANLARLAGTAKGANTVFARAVLVANEPKTVMLAFGYSDRVRVFLNDRLLYSGDNGYMSRDYRYLGTIGYFDAVALPLAKGENELWLAVSEDFGGWGVKAAVQPAGAVAVE